MNSIHFKATLISKSIVTSPLGEKLIKLEFVEEQPLPGPIVMGGETEMAREIAPIISQVMKTLPIFGNKRVNIPRLTLFLTENEWESLERKPEIGEEMRITVSKGGVEIN